MTTVAIADDGGSYSVVTIVIPAQAGIQCLSVTAS
jgi:hypothetical protein